MLVESFVFDAGFDGLKVAARRYRSGPHPGDGYVLVCAHATGMMKEIWDPTISAIFQVSTTLAVREIWSVDWMTHGDSAMINQDVVAGSKKDILVRRWADAITNFVEEAIPQEYHIIGIGHSAGATAVLFSGLTARKSSLILVEPVMITPECFKEHEDERVGALKMVSKFTLARKTSWPSRDAARKYFEARPPWKLWDRTVIDTYVEHALQGGPDGNTVSLKCPKEQEAAGYMDMQPHIDAAAKLAEYRENHAVHFILGQRDDSMPRYAQDSMISGQKTASVQWIPGAGHLVVQETPDELAVAISNILSLEMRGKAKL